MKRQLRVVFLVAAVFALTFLLLAGFRGLPAPYSVDLGGVRGAAQGWWSSAEKPSNQPPVSETDDSRRPDTYVEPQHSSTGETQDLGLGLDSDVSHQDLDLSNHDFDGLLDNDLDSTSSTPAQPTATTEPSTQTSVESSVPTTSSDINIDLYINAIMRPEDETLPRLQCPVPKYSRYDYLRDESSPSDGKTKLQYFFALDLYKCVDLLPRLMGSIVEVMHYLGPEKCALSIVEGRSDDGTYEVLNALGKKIESIGAQYYFQRDHVNPKAAGEDRIQALADLRNLALQPIIDHKGQFADDAAILFINDVAICSEDLLELLHQRAYQEADMVCAMDWTYVGADPTFYDVWVARGMNGDLFFNIPDDGSWNYAGNLFWNDAETRSRLQDGKAFQVYSCWNGATVFPAKPVMEKEITFRRSYDGECYQGEPQIFCKELWMLGYNKLAVVPAVNVEYSDEAGAKLKDYLGYTSNWIAEEKPDDPSLKIEWKGPPEQIKCMPEHTRKYWVPWNETAEAKVSYGAPG